MNNSWMLWPIVLVAAVVSSVALAMLRCGVAEVAVRVSVRLYSGDRSVRAAKREEWLRAIEDMAPSERPAHAGSLLWLGLRTLPFRFLPWCRQRRVYGGWRLVDVTVSSFALIVMAPTLLIAAVAVRIESGGPVLFRTVRIGRDGEAFNLLRFRTLELGAIQLEISDTDAYITYVGQLLRRFSIDEVPQLFNVLRGDMSLVGPRPSPASPPSTRHGSPDCQAWSHRTVASEP
jgi:hypothetical protein